MKVKFVGDAAGDGSDKAIEAWGIIFVRGQEVDVSHLPLSQQQKIAGNGHFQVTSGEPTPPSEPEKPKKAKG